MREVVMFPLPVVESPSRTCLLDRTGLTRAQGENMLDRSQLRALVEYQQVARSALHVVVECPDCRKDVHCSRNRCIWRE